MILVHGHRGAKARMPENTLPGFEYAIRIGVDAIELDVVVTQDGELVVSHDPILERGHAPTLDEVLWLAEVVQALSPANPFRFDVEIKTWSGPPPCPAPHEFGRRVLEKIRAHSLESRVSVMSFDFRVLKAMRALAPQIRLSALTENDPRSFPEIAREAASAEIVAPQFLLVTPEKVAAAHAARIEVVPWTVNGSANWDRMIAAGVDGIITDDPAELIAPLVSRGLRGPAC
ncbi:MAG TPA: glycerophosphodiester phosphodiesterase family protein [Bryobacteraceae bacterium]